MLRSRLFEEAIAGLWQAGLISGEMHLGTGEEAIIAGVVSQLRDGDAMALDHRGTAAFLMRGVDPASILRELLGHPEGLCRGMGGHMHLYSKEKLAASSGIVGSSGPCAAGFALAAQVLDPGSIAVAFFGEGAMNQGMLMESLNLAAAWNLPAVFVCKDDGWAVSTGSEDSTVGKLQERARGLGVHSIHVDGLNVEEVADAFCTAMERARAGEGPTFLQARCVHFEGHFLGYQLLRMVRNPVKEMPGLSVPLAQSLLHLRGSSLSERSAGLRDVLRTVVSALRDPRRDSANDPLQRTRKRLLADAQRLQKLEADVEEEVNRIVDSVSEERRS
jgi:pyruvate dehydrogenase E1 component alpha subunit